MGDVVSWSLIIGTDGDAQAPVAYDTTEAAADAWALALADTAAGAISGAILYSLDADGAIVETRRTGKGHS